MAAAKTWPPAAGRRWDQERGRQLLADELAASGMPEGTTVGDLFIETHGDRAAEVWAVENARDVRHWIDLVKERRA